MQNTIYFFGRDSVELSMNDKSGICCKKSLAALVGFFLASFAVPESSFSILHHNLREFQDKSGKKDEAGVLTVL